MIKGFDQVAGGPMLERPLGILIHCPNRQDENGNIPRGCVTLKLATNLITVHLGNHHVKQDKVWLLRPDQPKSLFPVITSGDIKPLGLQPPNQHLYQIWFIFHYNEFRITRHASSFGLDTLA